jgi:Glycosyl hydrolases family 2, TIM barrel domain
MNRSRPSIPPRTFPFAVALALVASAGCLPASISGGPSAPAVDGGGRPEPGSGPPTPAPGADAGAGVSSEVAPPGSARDAATETAQPGSVRDASSPNVGRDAAPPSTDGPPSPPVVSVPDAAGPLPGVDTRPVVSVSVSAFQLLVRRRNPDGSVAPPAPYDIRGISWSPAARGGGRPGPFDFTAAADRDLPLMRAANINTVKTYGAIERTVLDQLQASGILAIVTVVLTGSEDFAGYVQLVRDHPAVLMWVVGNEWNRNQLFGGCAGDACYARVNDIARTIKGLDPNHPVATSFSPNGSVPSDSDLTRLDAIDVWGLNIYSQPGFFNRFQEWRLLNMRVGLTKPFFMSEFGADAYNNRIGAPDEAAQAAQLRIQVSEIRAQLSARNPAFPCLGGTPFEWSDEWWKSGNRATQDTGGFANGGVAPDSFANEDWWGVVDVDRRPRAAYGVLQELYAR